MRRLFWVSLGAVAGVAGYRRATALVRSLRPAPRAGSVASFAADVREGMALYMERQSARAPATLEAQNAGPGERPVVPGASPRTPRPGTSRWPRGPHDSGTGALAASPGERSAVPGASLRTPRPGNPRWSRGRLARRAAPSRIDELKDGR